MKKEFFALAVSTLIGIPCLANVAATERVFSENHKMFAFARETAFPRVNEDDQESIIYAPEVIILGDTKTGKIRTIMSQKSFKVPDYGPTDLAHISDLCFGPSNTELFFRVRAWTMSDAILSIDLNSRKLRFVCPGNHLRIARDGKWKGNLIVEQHDYFETPQGGSYDWQYVISPTGKKLGIYQKAPVEKMDKLDRFFSRFSR